ncbi:MAG TPA: PIN domain-containing protein [Chloroflexi bacterium]|nr:PIN domain-containing protein [Chloroflexota bacterium]
MNSFVQPLVIDSNIGVWSIVNGPYLEPKAIREWFSQQATIVVPGLWVYEVTSVVYRYGRQKAVDARQALAIILDTPDEIIHPDSALAIAAHDWAERLGQAKAYDAFYLALAEQLGAEFWTGDKRLYNRARQVGADFVRFVSEASTGGG